MSLSMHRGVADEVAATLAGIRRPGTSATLATDVA
jgi:hypothetical protein